MSMMPRACVLASWAANEMVMTSLHPLPNPRCSPLIPALSPFPLSLPSALATAAAVLR